MASKKPEGKGRLQKEEAADGWSRGAATDHKERPVREPRGVWSSSPRQKTLLESPLRSSRRPRFDGEEPNSERETEEPVVAKSPTVPYTPKTEAELLFGEGESHDGGIVDKLVRRSTMPPVDRSSLDRILEDKTYTSPPSRVSRPLPNQSTNASAGPNLGEALDLVDRSEREAGPPSISGITADMAEEMEELYSVDDFTGALRIAELLLGGNPDHERARRCAGMCLERLEQIYINKIGSLTRVPVYALKEVDLRWLGLDHRAGFVLSRVDGKATVDELVDICGMPRIEVLKTLIELLNQGAIEVRDM